MANKMPRIRLGNLMSSGFSWLVVVMVGVALALLLVVMMQAPPRSAYAATDKLPDLSMARIIDVQIKVCADTRGDCEKVGQHQLRFATRIVNVGDGAFEVVGTDRDSTGVMRTVTQHIYDDAGGSRSVATVGNDGSSAQMYYAGDGHNHWHLKNLEIYTLSSSSSPDDLKGDKGGFCFFDNVKWFTKDSSGNPRTSGVPSDPVYTGCERDNPNATSVKAGLSRGWGDRYGVKSIGQFVDITDLPDGDYRLTATADDPDWFDETNNQNNATWVDLHISNNATQVSVTSYGGSNPSKV